MAEKRFIKGLFKDTAPLDQPEGSWRYARNMIFNDTDGAVSNEGGTELSGHLGDTAYNFLFTSVGDWTAKVVGKIEVDNDRVILFIVNEGEEVSTATPVHFCEIGIWENDVYKLLYIPDVSTYPEHSLNFSITSPIEGTYKIDGKEDLVIYWTDDNNPPRAFNVDRQLRWLNESALVTAPQWLYGIDPSTTHEDHIGLLDLFPNSGPVPHISIHDIYWVNRPYQKSVNTGGGLLTGVYYLALAYVDDDLVSTNYLTVSNPVSIVEEYDHTRPRNKKDGAKHGTQTTKAIKWRVDNLNTDYKYISPVIVRKKGDATEAFKLNIIETIPDSFGRIEVVFSGLEGFTPSSVEDIIIDTTSYESAKTMNQLDGVLYLGNLRAKKDLGYQKYANAIKLTAETKTFDNFDTFYATIDNLQTGFSKSEVDVFNGVFQDVDSSQSYRYIPNISQWKGYMRDEVYAFYIAFIMKDGSMSYAYHIPGRESTNVPLDMEGHGSSLHKQIRENSFLADIGVNTAPSPGSHDLSTLSVIYRDLQNLSPAYAKNFHFFDFSGIAGNNNMNYWENATEVYPSTDDYEVWDEFTFIDNNGITQSLAGTIQGNKVRHHHFPSNASQDHGIFNLVDDPGGGASRTGYLCDNAPTDINTVSPLPVNQSFKAYVEFSDNGVLPHTSGWYMIEPAGAPCGNHDFIDMQTLSADHTNVVKHLSAGGVASWSISHSLFNPGSIYETNNKIITIKAVDKYPFGDPTMIDAENVLTVGGLPQPSLVTQNQVNAFDQLWHGEYLQATQWMTVKFTVNINVTSRDSTNDFQVYFKLYRANTANWDEGNVVGITNNNASQWCGCRQSFYNGPPPATFPDAERFDKMNVCKDNGETVIMNAGDKLYIMAWKGNASMMADNEDVELPYSSKCDWRSDPGHAHYGMWNATKWQYQSEILFEVNTIKSDIDSEMLQDVKIEHSVNALGFTLSDLKIPKSIADEIQGFRIYHAKRGHSDRTVLGQAPSMPMRPDKAIIGICNEAMYSSNLANSKWVLQTLTDVPESLLLKEPWPTWKSLYPKYSNIYHGSINGHLEKHGYKSFAFYDFHLLRSKKSLSGATHIKPQYLVENFAWQGPSTMQPKKMISKIVEDTSTTPPIKRIEEEWGYNQEYNCYPGPIHVALFIGAHYNRYQINDTQGWFYSKTPFAAPRVLGQKAVSYLKGDSIFKAEALGFGGTVINNRGDSTIIYSLKDRHEQEAWNISLSSSCDDWSFYGGSTPSNPFYLAANPINPIMGNCNRNSYIDINNLHAFKTDVYKSIDDQELVFTGFEVVGQDLNNFIFWDKEAIDNLPTGSTLQPNIGDGFTFQYINRSGLCNNISGVCIDYTADFSIFTLQDEIQRDSTGNVIPLSHGRHHIFGGDTFICRYGFANGFTPIISSRGSRPYRGVHYHITESIDNINFRHIESDDSLYFPGTSGAEMLLKIGEKDFNDTDNMKYNINYSSVNDLRPAFPLPIRESKQDDFSTRTHRSVKTDPTSVIDNYRIFKANQFKDLPKNRGELWKLSTFNNLLYFHMEESLFAAKGKQSMQMKDGSEAFVGSGDIFQQDPDEIIHTDGGYGGTQSQWAALTTRFGYFFVDGKSNKIFLMKDKLLEISAIGMESWFKDNLSFALIEFGFGNCAIDNPIAGMGFHSVYDPKYKRIILTKREFIPTQNFINNYNLVFDGTNGPPNCPNASYAMNKIRFNSDKCRYEQFGPLKGTNDCGWTPIPFRCTGTNYFTCTGWTISYYPELGVWGSFHDYIPYIYFNTSTEFYSLTDRYIRPPWCTAPMISASVPGCPSPFTLANWVGTTHGNAGIWKHNGALKGILYQENILNPFGQAAWETDIAIYYPFEFEIIHNSTKSMDSLLSSFSYTLETFNAAGISVLEHGFTNFYLYNTFQISADRLGTNPVTNAIEAQGTTLEYLINVRRVGNNWKVNRFRDMAAIAIDTGNYYMSTNTNIIGGVNTGTITTSNIQNMFIINGMFENINVNYIDLAKQWQNRKKFIDKWVGIRLIYDNISNNLLNLYSTDVAMRKTYR